MQTSIRHSPLTISRAVPSSAKAAAQHRQRLPTVPVHLPSSPQTGGVRTAAAATETASPPAGAVDWCDSMGSFEGASEQTSPLGLKTSCAGVRRPFLCLQNLGAAIS